MDTMFCVLALVLCTASYGEALDSILREKSPENVAMALDTKGSTNNIILHDFYPDQINTRQEYNPGADMVQMLVPLAISITNFVIWFCLIYNGCFKCRNVQYQGQILGEAEVPVMRTVIPPLEKPAGLQDGQPSHEMKPMWDPSTTSLAGTNRFVNVQFGDEGAKY